MVGVVIHHRDFVPRTEHVESPRHPGENGTAGGELGERHPELEPDGQRRQCVEDVEPARESDPDLAQGLAVSGDGESAAFGRAQNIDGAQIGIGGEPIAHHRSFDRLGQRPRSLVIAAQDHPPGFRCLVAEFDKGRRQIVRGSVAIKVLGLEIGHDRHRRRDLEKGPVVLIGLADHDLAAADPGVGVGESGATADQHGGVEPGLGQQMTDQ